MRYAELAAAPFISTPAELRKGQIWTSELGIGLDRHLMHNSDLGMQRQHTDPPADGTLGQALAGVRLQRLCDPIGR